MTIDARQQSAADAREKSGQGKGPGLVHHHRNAARGELRALGDQRPGAAGLGGAVQLHQKQCEEREGGDVEEIGRVALGDKRSRHQLAAARFEIGGAEEACSARGKIPCADHRLECAREHQRDQRQRYAAHTQRRQTPDDADETGGCAARENSDLERRAEEGKPQRHPPADPNERVLAERDETELAEQEVDAHQGRHDRISRGQVMRQ